jgi:nicotinate dehydrogenase subunit B
MTEIVASRHKFLNVSGALVVYFTAAGAVRGAEESTTDRTVSPDDIQGFLVFHASGEVSVFVGKVDLGTGLQTAMMQIVAAELDVPMKRIRYAQGDAATTPDQGTTSGSFSIERGGVQLRRAAVTARQVLMARAADVLQVDRAQLTMQGGIIRTQGTRQIALGNLIKDTPIALPVDTNAPTKPPSDYRIVGKPVRRLEIPGKVTARLTYIQDFRLPGRLHGRVIRPPAIGANLLQVNESSLDDIPGIVQVVRINDFLGVVARTEWAAIRAAQTLAVTVVGCRNPTGPGETMGRGARNASRNRRRHRHHGRHRSGAADGEDRTCDDF